MIILSQVAYRRIKNSNFFSSTFDHATSGNQDSLLEKYTVKVFDLTVQIRFVLVILEFLYIQQLQLIMKAENSQKNSHILNEASEQQSQHQSPINEVQIQPQDKTPTSKSKNKENATKDQNLQRKQIKHDFKPKKSKKINKKQGKTLQFSNHNFQKHTVVTVKKLGASLTNNIGTSEAEELAKRIWLTFLTSEINTKKILLILFGKANLGKQACKELFRECYLGQLCSLEENMVQQAQNILRMSFLAILDDQLIRIHTKKSRNIYHKEEFIAYFLHFVEELRNGPFMRSRIDNQTKKKIEKRVKVQKLLSKQKYKRNKTYVYQQLQ